MTRTYAVLRIPAIAYQLIRREIAKLPKSDYGHMISKEPTMPEMLQFDGVGLESLPIRFDAGGIGARDVLAEILETVAKDGLEGPRDLDVALDAIQAIYGDLAERLEKVHNLALTGSGLNVAIYSDDILRIFGESK